MAKTIHSINSNFGEEKKYLRKIVLIATDVAARGLDIQDIQFVINIDVRDSIQLVVDVFFGI